MASVPEMKPAKPNSRATSEPYKPVEVDKVSLTGLVSQDSGVIWIGVLPYGTYTIAEGLDNNYRNPEATFTLIVDENGFRYRENVDYTKEIPQN